jgi:hypothetical protein
MPDVPGASVWDCSAMLVSGRFLNDAIRASWFHIIHGGSLQPGLLPEHLWRQTANPASRRVPVAAWKFLQQVPQQRLNPVACFFGGAQV